MADVDPLTLFPTTAPPSSGGGTAAKDDDPLKLFPTMSPKKTAAAQGPDLSGGYISPTGDYVPAQAIPGVTPSPSVQPIAPAMPQPAAAQPAQPAPDIGAALGRIGAAAGEGWEGSPRVPANLVTAPIYNPLLAGLGAVFRAGQQAVVEATPNISLPSLPPGVNIPLGGGRFISGELTPGPLGRELAALPEAFPTGINDLRPPGRPPIPGTEYRIPMTDQRVPFMHGGPPETPPPPSRFVQEYYGEGTPGNPLAAAPAAERPAFVPPGVNIPPRPMETPAFVPPSEGRPAPATGAAQGGEAPPSAAVPVNVENRAWVGNTKNEIDRVVQENAAAGGPSSLNAAATPEELASMSPQMAKAYRRMAEVKQIVSPIEGEDATTYVPGSVPTEAERMGDPNISQKEVMTRQRAPDAFEGEQGRLTQNNKARLKLYDDQTLSDPQIETLRERQIEQAKTDTAEIMKNAQPVDLRPVANQVEGLLNDPRIAEQPEVVKVLKPIRDALYDADGNLKSNPKAVWGMHDNLMTRLDKAKDPLQATSSEKYAFNQLVSVKKAMDGAMSDATGGAFRTFLDNQAEFIKQQNAAKLLRDFRTKMTDSKGNIYSDRFHKFVTDLAVRRGRPGVDPSMDIPDETMQTLINIDQDLKRAGRIDLGKPRGSPTNLYFELAQGLGIVGAHSLVNLMGGGPIANIGLQAGINAASRRLGAYRLNRLVRQATQPPANPLTPP